MTNNNGADGTGADGSVEAARPASGEQFVLSSGGARAVIGQVAAVLREFSVDGVHYTETWADDALPPMGAGIVLAPWPNRVEDGKWTAPDGSAQQLDITEPGRYCAIHGLLRNTPYAAVERSASSVTLAAPVYPQHGYPFNLDTAVRYELTGAGLRVTHTVTNRGAETAPFGIGAHPYLRVGDTPIADLTLTVSARTQAPIDDRWIPQGLAPVGEHGPDLRAGKLLGEVRADIALTDLELVDGRFEHRLAAPDGRGVTVWTDPDFSWVQLYTPQDFPADPANPRPAVAIEPMTCGANAFNTGRDVLTVRPGESWSASWGISPHPA
ncbi:aldose 1-epimerase family protein [Nakamurella lactea]|uniref:aldose 1-epimerase family protein n=1 Tax=Nakamurella lactea TaxID=459515 RepID=UPI0004228E6F|nr:aldose 1-epimerase family protein [Nakamurella lactea]